MTATESVDTNYLIVGAGPAGAALACFLAEYGLTGIMIAAAPGTADTPRAHITNMAALECLRDIGLDKACLEEASTNDNMAHTRWCYSMAGEEFARIHSWGHDPEKAGIYAAASACKHVDLPQTKLEPILVNRAVAKGWDVRWSTALQSFEETPEGAVIGKVTDGAGRPYDIRTKYLFGCDGARSQVIRQLQMPMIKKPGQGTAVNVYVDVDLSHLMETRVGNLHWVIQPDVEYPAWGKMGIVRMVEPWTKWMFIILPDPTVEFKNPTEEECLERVREMVGDRSLPAKIINVSTWTINETVAERYSKGNIFCLGDAVHRHPPFNGLGSNTCIQDAYNLAWKIAYTDRGHASPSLLSSYSVERQPVGLGVVSRANQGLRDHVAVWEALGMTEPDLAARTAAYRELDAKTAGGRARREALRRAIRGTETEFHAVGREMGQRYDEYGSGAVVLDDEESRAAHPENEDLEYLISTFPGSRLPHAWINTRTPRPQIGTNDLAGHGAFCVLTGPGGDAWKEAAAAAAKALGAEINAYSIGWNQDYEDVYGDWARRCEIEEDGCILVRPDRFVGWRSKTLREDATESLERALKKILGTV